MFGVIIFDAFIFASAGFVWICVLVQPSMLFDWFPDLLTKFVKSEYVQYPIIHCAKCCAGQIAFWCGLYQFIAGAYSLHTWFAVVILAITFASFLESTYNKIK